MSIAVLAHDEERSIARVLRAHLRQRIPDAEIVEILVISCGSTDRTNEIVARMAAGHRILTLMTRPRREGKLRAIEVAAGAARGDVLVLGGGDTVPADGALAKLVRPILVDRSCGMTGPRVVPEPSARPVGRLHVVMWELHHEMADRVPKLGEVVAVRATHVDRPLPRHVYCDEVLLEARVLEDGAVLRYVPSAVVHNQSPTGLRELFAQRRRIACQHLAARRIVGYRPASSRMAAVLASAARSVVRAPDLAPAVLALALLEAAARVRGRLDYATGRRYRTWAPSTRVAA